MSNDEALDILNQLKCSTFNPYKHSPKILIEQKRACNAVRQDGQGEEFSCVCDRVDDAVMELQGVIDDYPV